MPRISILLTLLLCSYLARADITPREPPAAPPVHYAHDALATITAARRLRCGLITAAEDYSPASTHGDVSAFGRGLCRAIAAALLGSPDRVTLDGFPDDMHGVRALHDNHIDLLFGLTPDAASALPYGVAFAPTALFDSQGFLVARTSGITRPEQLAHKLLCFITGTSQEARMNVWGAAHHVAFYAHDFQERGEMDAALVAGKCDAITDDVTALAQMRAGFHGRINDFMILPQRIAIDAWAPSLRAGEVRLNAVVTDVLHALITGEELGITALNLTAPHPGAELLLTKTPGIAQTLNMPDGWASRALALGNYAELYTRTLGLDRGPDALWSNGGMLAAPGLR